MNAQPKQPTHHILVDEPGLLLAQCLCCGEVEVRFRGLALSLNLTDVYALVTRLDTMPTAPRYLVGLLDVRDTLVQAGFQAIGMSLTEGERDQLLRGLNIACLRLDLDLITQHQTPPN